LLSGTDHRKIPWTDNSDDSEKKRLKVWNITDLNKRDSLSMDEIPMTTMHHVIPHPGFLRDAGSPEQALHIQGEFCPSSPPAPVREPKSDFAANHLQVLMNFDEF
jgi:hypothetical protein